MDRVGSADYPKFRWHQPIPFPLKSKGKPLTMLATTLTGVNYTDAGSPANAAIV